MSGLINSALTGRAQGIALGCVLATACACVVFALSIAKYLRARFTPSAPALVSPSKPQ